MQSSKRLINAFRLQAILFDLFYRLEEYTIITANDTAPPPNATLPDGPLHPNLGWPTPGGINESQTRQICQAPILDSPLFDMCENFTVESFEVITENCMLDIQVSEQNRMNFVNAFYSVNLAHCNITESCMTDLQV